MIHRLMTATAAALEPLAVSGRDLGA